jgi:hypothetical protein
MDSQLLSFCLWLLSLAPGGLARKKPAGYVPGWHPAKNRDSKETVMPLFGVTVDERSRPKRSGGTELTSTEHQIKYRYPGSIRRTCTMAQNETTLIHAFRKNALEQVHLSLRQYHEREYLDLRAYYQGDDGEYLPTRRGITLALDSLDELETGLQKVREQRQGGGT